MFMRLSFSFHCISLHSLKHHVSAPALVTALATALLAFAFAFATALATALFAAAILSRVKLTAAAFNIRRAQRAAAAHPTTTKQRRQQQTAVLLVGFMFSAAGAGAGAGVLLVSFCRLAQNVLQLHAQVGSLGAHHVRHPRVGFFSHGFLGCVYSVMSK